MNRIQQKIEDSRSKQKAALLIFVIVFAIFALFVMVNVLAEEGRNAAIEKADTEAALNRLRAN